MSAERAAERRDLVSIPAIAVLCAVGALTFCAFLIFGAYGLDRNADPSGVSALSKAGSGYAGLVRLLRAEGASVTLRRHREAQDGERDVDLLVLTPPPSFGQVPPQLFSDTTILLILPKWHLVEDPDHRGWMRQRGLVSSPVLQRLLPRPLQLQRAEGEAEVELHGGSGLMEDLSALPAGTVDRLTFGTVSADWTPVLLAEGSRPVLLRWTGHDLYVLTDPDLLSNRGLKTRAQAETAVLIVDRLRDGGPLAFDLSLAGIDEGVRALRLLFDPPLLAVTLCAVAAAGLLLLKAARRFGPPLPARAGYALGKRALADNVAGLIAQAGRETRMLAAYVRLIRHLAARDLGLQHRLDAASLDAGLDAAAAARGSAERWTTLLAAAQDRPAGPETLRLALKLHQWQTGLTRGRP